jgi:U3 small nucleolar RNA-associated protein MPP10
MSESDEENSAAVASAAVNSEEDNTLEQFLEFIQDDSSIASLLYAKKNPISKDNDGTAPTVVSKHRSMLLQTCQELFQRVEGLARTLQQVNDDQDTTNTTALATTSLSGLDELYLGTTDIADEEPVVDAETVWGQVDLQNEILHSILKKSLKRLSKVADANDDKIQLLDLESEVFQGDEDTEDTGGESESEEEDNDDDHDKNENAKDDDDEMTRRMRERMERALKDQDDDHDSFDGENTDDEDDEDKEDFEDTRFFGKKAEKHGAKSTKPKPTNDPVIKEDEEDDLIDPAAEELNNGFFDINEMEAFADEEEDMLPEEVWEPTPKERTNKSAENLKSFHQRQREGIESDNDEDNSDDDDDDDKGLFNINQSKRKKYREDDEIEALYSLYKAPTYGDNDDDNDDDNDAVNMTAADLFGAPNKKYLHKWKAQQAKENTSKKPPASKKGNANKESAKDDDDSWDAYHFETERADWGEGKDTEKKEGKVNEDDADADSGSGPDDDDDGSDGSDSDGLPNTAAKQKEGRTAPKKQEKPNATKKPAKPKSKFLQQQEKLKEETERLQQELIQEKPWQMMGEASSGARPVNSLLDGTPEFQFASKMAPVITEAHTANLEDIIRQRILAEDWDDIIPRELPDVAWHKKRGELPEVSQEKAKLGLGELYEREFLKKAVGYDVDAAEKESEEEKAKNEMKQLFANICSKLDALSNYHFAPRPVADEAEVRPATTPAIAMEEVLPLHVSDARGAAPEEVYGKKRRREGILRSEAELEQVSFQTYHASVYHMCQDSVSCFFSSCLLQTERKRIRASKKTARRKSRKQKDADNKLIARVNPGLGLNNPYEKRKAKEETSMARAEGRIIQGRADDNTKYGSSNKFFKKLQDDVSKTLRDDQESNTEPKKAPSSSRKSSSFKL